MLALRKDGHKRWRVVNTPIFINRDDEGFWQAMSWQKTIGDWFTISVGQKTKADCLVEVTAYIDGRFKQ